MKKINSDKLFVFVNTAMLLLIVFLMVYPLYFTIIASVSNPTDVATGKVYFFPSGINWMGYREIFKEKSIWRGYLVSLYYTGVGTLFNLFLTFPTAYALSKKKMHFRKGIQAYFIFTMFFGGGLLPFYMLVRDLNLLNKPYTMIVLGGLSVYNVVVARTYFSTSISESLYEAAEVDGCSEFRKFFQIALPLSKPIIAVIALYYAVARWNDWFGPMLYLSKSDYYPLQTVLKNLLLGSGLNMSASDAALMSGDELLAYTQKQQLVSIMKYGVIFIGSAPLLIAYPFIQKYFVKGVMIGSLKE